MSKEALKKLKIKVDSVKRLRTDLQFYEKDAVREQQRFDKLKESGVELHSLTQAENVLSEAKAMIPDSKQRLESAIRDLKNYLTAESEELEETEEYKNAYSLLSEVQPLIV